jgi:hypothetical protein
MIMKIEMTTSSQHCSMVEKLVHACKVPCACMYVWVIEGIELKSNPQIHLELFQGIASNLREVLGSDVSKKRITSTMLYIDWKMIKEGKETFITTNGNSTLMMIMLVTNFRGVLVFVIIVVAWKFPPTKWMPLQLQWYSYKWVDPMGAWPITWWKLGQRPTIPHVSKQWSLPSSSWWHLQP